MFENDKARRVTASRLTVLVVAALLLARPLAAQDDVPSERPSTNVGARGAWDPLGQMPVDQADAGLRGYALASESSDVSEPGTGRVSLQTVVSNSFYREQTGSFLITQRYETHTVALGYRHGFKVGLFPRVEVGGQIQLAERDSGFLNGVISGFEGLLVSISGQQSARNPLRTSASTLPPLGAVVRNGNQTIYQAPGDGSGFGDVSLVAKALVRDGAESPAATRVAVRVAANLSGQSAFTAGNFVGVGISVDKRLTGRLALHGDLGTARLLDSVRPWHLPLKAGSVSFLTGSEVRITRNNSLNVQIGGSSSPYVPNGTTAFDASYGNITIGLGHRSTAGGVVTQFYVRENMNLPFRVRWNLDPDVAIGVKTTIRVGSANRRAAGALPGR